ncbi:10594_t:CDS:2 [Funneliformis mosseae]|uniref:10594_t:CDS:1 n=1 Tax=Funneliformis mosseae TaxID=27381 RepID=A0A9N8Z0C8_FUNMO|nr:10594_t:CDS:2 [Funneliformis mosseae]
MSDRGSYSSTSASPSTNNKEKSKDYHRMDCKKIQILPTNGSLDYYTDGRMAVRFHESTQEMSLWLNDLKDEIFIPFDQLKGFRIAEYKELEVSLVLNFHRRYYQNDVEVKGDPTNGLLEKATSLIITPRNNVPIESLTTIEDIIDKYRFGIFLATYKISSIRRDPVNSIEIYVKFFMYVERGGVVVPEDISLDGIIQTISKKFKFYLNSDRLSYKNGVDVIIAIRDEEDWSVAKWESRYSNTKPGVELYFI